MVVAGADRRRSGGTAAGRLRALAVAADGGPARAPLRFPPELREAAAAGQVLQGRHDKLLRRLEGQHTRLSSLEGRLEDLLGAERDLAAQLAALRETMEREHGPRGPDTQSVIDPATEEWERQLEQCLSALHSGDRAYLRGCGAREMNLTQASKEDLAVGTDTPPRLEPVGGGGSYLLLSLGERHWLLPTESTLDGFRHPLTRPRRGIFTTTGASYFATCHGCAVRPASSGTVPSGCSPSRGWWSAVSAASRASRRASRRLSRSRSGSAGGWSMAERRPGSFSSHRRPC